MNFFQHQANARLQTKKIVIYFILAIVFITLGINSIVYGLFAYNYTLKFAWSSFLSSKIWVPISIGVPTFILLVSIIKTLFLSKGGVALAKMLNAMPIPPDTQDFKVKRLINIVEEMSIASGTPIPRLFVLNDNNINAMVAGFHPEDTVMIVTQGALDTLNRDELQGVVGHEFSHISNSDMSINLKLVGVLAGIFIIYQAGWFILRAGLYSRGSKKGNAAQALILGLGLVVVGGIGWVFGRLIKASVSRQRELLADACSVQYTRNPHGIVSAFRRMLGIKKVGMLDIKQTEDVNHMCLLSPSGQKKLKSFNNPLDTHPALDYRILTLDPHGKYPLMPEDSANEVFDEITGSKAQKRTDEYAEILVSAAIISNSIGNPSEIHFAKGKKIYNEIQDDIKNAAHNKELILDLLMALIFVRYNLNDAGKYLSPYKEYINTDVFTKQSNMLKNTNLHCFIPIMNIAFATYSQIEQTKKDEIYKVVYSCLNTLPPKPFRFCFLTLLDRYTHPVKERLFASEIKDLTKCEDELTLIFSMMLFYAKMSPKNTEMVYGKVLTKLINKIPPMPNIEEFKPAQLKLAFNKLNKLSPRCKELLIKALTKTATIDKKITIEEGELLRVIGECLECPIPPIDFIGSQ
jgi:Zn-dependent protease with chaperone function